MIAFLLVASIVLMLLGQGALLMASSRLLDRMDDTREYLRTIALILVKQEAREKDCAKNE